MKWQLFVHNSLEIAGGLKPVQMEIEDDRLLNVLKYKNVLYRSTPLGILFPASVENNTEQIFLTTQELNNVNKALISSKMYGSLETIDLKKRN